MTISNINARLYCGAHWRSRAVGSIVNPERQCSNVVGIIYSLRQIEIGLTLWQYWLRSFQTKDTELERFLFKNQHTKRKLLNFEFWINGEVSKSARIWLSKSIFYVKNHPTLSNFFSQKNTNSGPHFSLTFFDKINFQITLLLKWGHIFDSSPIIQNSKFNKFLWVCWFLCKNLSNSIPPAWKLHNLYCHNE